MPRRTNFFFILIRVAAVLGLLVPAGLMQTISMTTPQGTALAAPVMQETTITLVVSSVTGEPIPEFKYLINEDNTGDPFNEAGCDRSDPDYPDNCDLPSIRTVPGWSPIVTQGDETETTLTLPDGKYLVSVQAEGYKLDGEHFSIPDDDGIVEVKMHAFPLPPATMVIQVFEDNSLTNGQLDAAVENGLAGFRASLNDIAGEITTDIFGNPLCTIYQKDAAGNVLYDENGDPIIQTLGKGCYSDADGMITIPNLGPMRYDVLVFPPTGESWIQTTTLEGAPGWDTWLQEAGTGLDNEFLIAAEPAPWTMFGYVKPNTPDLGGTGTITGKIMGAATFIPAQGGIPYIGDTFAGFMGTKEHRPIVEPWLSLNDLQAGDTAVWVGRGNADGTFTVPNVPEGNYFLTYWDEKQHYILDFVQVTVTAGEISDVGTRHLTGWFTEVSGTVFVDNNENGVQDLGEPGLPNYMVVLRDRDNTEIDRMSIAAMTDASGFYELEKGYPMGSWMILEAYSDLFRTTGVNYQTLNMAEPEVLPGAIVDIGLLPILGQPVELNWGVKRYTTAETGGIAGTVFYDTVRAEDEARYAGAEPWQPGIPDLTVNLYEAVVDNYGRLVKDPYGGAALKGKLLNSTVTETFARPKGCTVRDVDGNPVDFPSVPLPEAGKDCLEGPLMGTQIGDGQNDLDGNWGFEDGCFGEGGYDPISESCVDGSEPTPLTGAKNYLVEVIIPEDQFGKPMFQVTREEDLNIFDGDEFIPSIPPPACVGDLHIVDVMDDPGGVDWYPEMTIVEDGVTITVPASTPVENPNFAAEFESRYEGVPMPLCDVKHVYLPRGAAVAPIFNLFTEVPIPGKWKGYIIDNLNVSTDPNTLFFGEMAGVPKVPIGLYDYSGRLVHTVHSDFNGVYEVLLPSTGTFNAPSPSGMFAGVYYLNGNDPGTLENPNPYWNPQYRSIGTSFEIYPGTIVPSDLAPTQNGASIWAPGAQFTQLALCRPEENRPQLFTVSKPYGSAGEAIEIVGLGFGASGTLTLGGIPIATTSWSDSLITFNVPADLDGPYQLLITGESGLTTINGLTFHARGKKYAPAVFEVGVGKTYDPSNTAVYDGTARGPIQHALDDAWAYGGEALVVVYPGHPVPMVNPMGWYIENPIIYSTVKLQGVGPGGILPSGAFQPGAVIDGRGVGGDSPYNLWWREEFLPDIWLNRGGWDGSMLDGDGNPIMYEGAVITVLAEDKEFDKKKDFRPSIDGLTIQGGDQQGFPNNIFQVGGGQIPGVAANVTVQGGGVLALGYARTLDITNNLIWSNGGAYAGAIRLGTPDRPDPYKDNQNDNVRILHNRILANGGTNLAGAIGVFAGSEAYEIGYNDVCGNTSIEYGGGISHYGYSKNGQIHHNRIYFNKSYDEGGGIMIAGELPADPTILSPGAGAVTVHDNLIQSNLANDDGGGLRFLMAGVETFDVYNNIVVNNVSTHEGGGISLNDAPFVNIVNNTIMKNITTATAMTSDGTAAPAGLSSSRNSDLLQKKIASSMPVFSDPLVMNNAFWDNRAGSWDGNALTGIGLPGDTSELFYWDLGVADGSGNLSPIYSLMQTPYGTNFHASNLIGVDPMVEFTFDTELQIFPWRGNANFVSANIVSVATPTLLAGDYHLQEGSPAIDAGIDKDPKTAYKAPTWDIDGDTRPAGTLWDIGADEVPTAAALSGFFQEALLPLVVADR